MAEDNENAGWSLTESDPAVFTSLLSSLDVSGLQVEDLWSLDELEAGVGPHHSEILGLIFLFKYVGGVEESSKAGVLDPEFPGFFANQVINNACASIALLNAVFNLQQSSSTPSHPITLGSELTNLQEFTVGMDPMSLGYTIGNSDHIRTVHNSFARSSPFSLDGSKDPNAEKEDAYHFITYIPFLGSVYELDGLQSSARRHGSFEEGGWLKEAKRVVEERIASYSEGALHFSLLAITPDPLPSLLSSLTLSPTDEHLKSQIQLEEDRRQKNKIEIELRRHNHISLIHHLLKALAKDKNKWTELVEGAREKGKGKRERDEERKSKRTKTE